MYAPPTTTRRKPVTSPLRAAEMEMLKSQLSRLEKSGRAYSPPSLALRHALYLLGGVESPLPPQPED